MKISTNLIGRRRERNVRAPPQTFEYVGTPRSQEAHNILIELRREADWLLHRRDCAW
jgi:hypothetical protein